MDIKSPSGFFSPVITTLIWIPIKVSGGNADFVYSVLLYTKLKESIEGFFILIKYKSTIKFLDQAVTFPVESTCIPRGILHSHGEERVYPVERRGCLWGECGEEGWLWRSVCAGLIPLPCAVPVRMCWVPECGKLWFSSLYFLGPYFKNNTVIDFPLQ